MKEIPKCLICGRPIDFFASSSPLGGGMAVCGCPMCNLIIEQRFVIHDPSSFKSTEEWNDFVAPIRKEMIESYIAILKDNGISDKKSAERYLQRCYTDATKRVKE